MKYGYLKMFEGQLLTEEQDCFVNYDVDTVIIDEMDSFNNLLIASKAFKSYDTLIIQDLMSLTYSVKELTLLLDILVQLKVRLIIINENIDTRKEKFHQFYYVLQTYLAAQKEGKSFYHVKLMRKKKSEGVELGRPSIDTKIIENIKYLRFQKKLNYREIGEICGISIGSVSKYLRSSEKNESD